MNCELQMRKTQIRDRKLALKSSTELKNILKQVKKSSELNILNNLVDSKKQKNSQRKGKVISDIKSFQNISSINDIVSGKSLLDYFKVGSKIGEGAHAVVYKSTSITTHNVHAIKFLKKSDPELVQMMRQTYQIMKVLDHQYMIKANFLFIQEKANVCQVVTEYYDYPELRAFISKTIKNNSCCDESTVANIIHKILMVVSYLQQKGVCHRDIKPQNILFDEFSGNIKLLDFELARMHRYTHQKIDLWSSAGTLSYRAPESFYGGYGPEIDVWAVGVIAFEMLIGQLPYQGVYRSQIIRKIRSQNLNFGQLPISKPAKSFLRKLLEKDPSQRISAKQALLDPFLLKNVSLQVSTCISPMNSSFDQGKTPEAENDDQNYSKHRGFYDQSVEFSFLGALSEDIGIRVNDE